ncbi:endogenous retrovirus group K member 113 Env polyprotein [Microcebus murinus]|uniref:endogenous retrovirus group K member 113 Env polyprotein-like n=1 Tax=Microcebus murinus TaxID=30608 RepID=UPI003F6DA23B
MLKARAGSQRGWYARQDLSIENRMNRLKLQDDQQPPLTMTTRQALLPSWSQIKRLTEIASKLVRETGQPLNSLTLFLAMVTLLSTPTQAATYWTYIPDPPLLHPVGWGERVVPVYVSDPRALGAPANDHIQHAKVSAYNYTGLTRDVPICFHREGYFPGCVLVSTYVYYNIKGVKWTVFMSSLDRRFSGSAPSDLPPLPGILPCEKEPVASTLHVPWRRCREPTATKIPILGTTQSIYDWTPAKTDNGYLGDKGFVEGLWTTTSKV